MWRQAAGGLTHAAVTIDVLLNVLSLKMALCDVRAGDIHRLAIRFLRAPEPVPMLTANLQALIPRKVAACAAPEQVDE